MANAIYGGKPYIKALQRDAMTPEDELLRPVAKHEIKEKSKVWKYFWSFVGFILIILILSYMLSGYTVMSVIAGKIASEKVQDNVVISDYGDIIFQEEAYQELKELYHTNEKEFRACLFGDFHDGVYLINKLFLPTMHFQDYDQVVSSPCPTKTLLDLHSHPQDHCIFSDVDINGFAPTEENTLLTVMCNDNRFIFYKKTI